MWCIFQKKVVKDNAALLKIIKLCIFQKKVIKDNATLLKIVETPTKDVFLKVNRTWTKIQVTPLPEKVNMT